MTSDNDSGPEEEPFPVSQDDDGNNNKRDAEDDIPAITIKASPLANKRRKNNRDSEQSRSQATKEVPKANVKITLVDPQEGEDSIYGVVIQATGFYGDTMLCDALYRVKGDPIKDEFLKLVGSSVSPHVYESYKFGSSTEKWGRPGIKKFFASPTMVLTLESLPTKKVIQTLVNENLGPASWRFGKEKAKNKTTIDRDMGKQKDCIHLHDDHMETAFRTVHHWDQVLCLPSDILWMASHEQGSMYAFKDWLQQDKDHLYNLYTPGKVDLGQFNSFYISPKQFLRDEDQARYAEYLKKKSSNKASASRSY